MKTTRKLSILLILLFSVTMAYSQCETYLQKANTLFAEKKYEDAKRQYLNYKECKPNAQGIDGKIAECDCEIRLQEAETLFSQKKYADAKSQYSNYKKCNPNAKGIDEKIAECDRSLRGDNNTPNAPDPKRKIAIGIRSFTGDVNKRGIAETKTTEIFTSDGRFNVIKDQKFQIDVDYFIGGNVTYTPAKTTNTKVGNQSIPITTTPEVISIAFSISDAKTGQILANQTVKINDIDDFISTVFPIKCSIKNISGKEAEIVTIGGGKVYKGDVFNVYEVKTDGGYTRKNKIGELKVTAIEGDFIKCKFKDGENTITSKFKARANLVVEK